MIREMRESAGLTQIELAKAIGVSERTMRRYEQEEDIIQIGVLKKILNVLSENDFYLHSIYPPSIPQPPKILNNDDEDIIHIPIYNVYASAGEGYINEETLMQHISLNKALLKHYFGLSSCKDLSVITARGDSMHPVIPENSQLLMQKKEVGDGQICITRIDNELYVKRLQKLPKYKLISDNKCYDDIELEGKDYEIIGVVVGLFQKI